MEFIGNLIAFSLALMVVTAPIYFSLFKYGFIKSLLASSVVCSVLVTCIYWGADVLVDLRLSLMGYDLNGYSDTERLERVLPELREEANQLYHSRFGVGWPLSVILVLSTIVAPYIFISVSAVILYKKWRKKTTK